MVLKFDLDAGGRVGAALAQLTAAARAATAELELSLSLEAGEVLGEAEMVVPGGPDSPLSRIADTCGLSATVPDNRRLGEVHHFLLSLSLGVDERASAALAATANTYDRLLSLYEDVANACRVDIGPAVERGKSLDVASPLTLTPDDACEVSIEATILNNQATDAHHRVSYCVRSMARGVDVVIEAKWYGLAGQALAELCDLLDIAGPVADPDAVAVWLWRLFDLFPAALHPVLETAARATDDLGMTRYRASTMERHPIEMSTAS